MNESIFINLLFAHLIGDYLLQTNRMALNKKKIFIVCLHHCLFYTYVVILFTMMYIQDSIISKGMWIVYVFLSHIVLDGTNIVNWWLKILGSRSYESTHEYFNDETVSDELKNYSVAYTAIVQTVADNTIHLLLMYYGYIFMKSMNLI